MPKRAFGVIALILTMLTPLVLGLLAPLAGASSHREAPMISNDPAADNTDFYMFRSQDNPNTVTFIANYIPLQASYGGPNFFHPADDVLYSIKIDNNGDAQADVVYQFKFRTVRLPSALGGPAGDTYLYNDGPITSLDDPNLLVRTYYTLTRIVVDTSKGANFPGGLRGYGEVVATGQVAPAFIGRFSYCADQSACTEEIAKRTYESVAGAASIPTSEGGRVFVGPRQEGFYVDLAKVFDLARLGSLNPAYGRPTNSTAAFNVTSMAIQVPIGNLRNPVNNDPVIGGWATASRPVTEIVRRRSSGRESRMREGVFRQVSRLGSPLVNEVVIGAKDKDRFNLSEPKDDVANFGDYVLNPRLSAILNALYNVGAKTSGRGDLVQVFVTGIPPYTRSMTLTRGGEMLRLNTAVPPTPVEQRKDLGVVAGDLGGFPNGRRVTDDVLDVELSAVAFQTCTGIDEGFGPGIVDAQGNVVCKGPLLGDGVDKSGLNFTETFPFLPTPLSGN